MQKFERESNCHWGTLREDLISKSHHINFTNFKNWNLHHMNDVVWHPYNSESLITSFSLMPSLQKHCLPQVCDLYMWPNKKVLLTWILTEYNTHELKRFMVYQCIWKQEKNTKMRTLLGVFFFKDCGHYKVLLHINSFYVVTKDFVGIFSILSPEQLILFLN